MPILPEDAEVLVPLLADHLEDLAGSAGLPDTVAVGHDQVSGCRGNHRRLLFHDLSLRASDVILPAPLGAVIGGGTDQGCGFTPIPGPAPSLT